MVQTARSKGATTRFIVTLLARHRSAMRTYAGLCAMTPATAARLETAAAQAVFRELTHYDLPAVARPRLLVAVREAAEHLMDAPHTVLSSALEQAVVTGSVRPAPHRRLVARAFRELPPDAQCLLWHREVEKEDYTRIAPLMGIEEGTAATQAAYCRGLLLSRCTDLHAKLAPTRECTRYTRLLEASCRRPTPADVHAHCERCLHCRHAAAQFDQSDDGLPLLLAEAVLGWGAKDYLRLRRATATQPRGDQIQPARTAARHAAPRAQRHNRGTAQRSTPISG
ncbi:hypothetical protein ACFVJ4_37500 [Streptomyces sp. NPDC127178]|uniref:hypothetical protein n=1 Tax=unclassified Streptomyces TaxID=2593676 RepID=UPI003637C551